MQRTTKTNMLQVMLISILFISTSVYANTNDEGVKIKWGYQGNMGPERWAQLDPSFMICAKGKSQSPINIIKEVKSSSNGLMINYRPAPMVIVNNGQTDLMIGNTQTIIDDGHGIQLNFPAPVSQETIKFNGKDFRLVQFHLHTPSENAFHEEIFPMEIHFVHQGSEGQIAVIGVWVRGGQENASLQKIINHLPKEQGKEFPIAGEQINPLDLMPAKRDYYSFAGSLTTPPCSEGVQWAVMAEPITASPAQIFSLKTAMGGANARPLQPLNQRTISYSMEMPH